MTEIPTPSFPLVANAPVKRPWVATILLMVFFAIPGLLLCIAASMGGERWVSIACLAWGAIGCWGIFVLWVRRKEQCVAWWTSQMQELSIPSIVQHLEAPDLSAEDALDILDYLCTQRPGWSTQAAQCLVEPALDKATSSDEASRSLPQE